MGVLGVVIACIVGGAALLNIALGLIYFVLQIAWITLPAWASAAAIMFVIIYLFTTRASRPVRSRGVFAKTVPLRFDSQKMCWYMRETTRSSYLKAGLGIAVAVILALPALWLILRMPHIGEAFDGVVWWFSYFSFVLGPPAKVDPQGSFVCGCIFSVIPLLLLGVGGFIRLTDSLNTRARYLLNHMNRQLAGIGELKSLRTSIGTVAKHLGISFPMNFQQRIAGFVNAHKAELLADTTDKLNKVITQTIEEGREDLKGLKQAQETYDHAMDLYNQTAHEVNKTGSISLIKQLEDDYEGLRPERFGELLIGRKWAVFHSIFDSLIDDIERLKEVALKYQQEGYEEEPKDREEEEPERGKMTEERAYSILGVRPPMSCTGLKAVYRDRAKRWHPDRQGDKKKAEARMTDLNLAYEFLKKIGKCN